MAFSPAARCRDERGLQKKNKLWLDLPFARDAKGSRKLDMEDGGWGQPGLLRESARERVRAIPGFLLQIRPNHSESSSVVWWQPIICHFSGSRLKAFATLRALPVSFAAWPVEMASQGYKAEMAPAGELEVTEVTNTHSIKAQKTRVSEEFKELEKNDPLLKENPRRWVMFPLQHPEVGH